jgi:hypothetical protein
MTSKMFLKNSVTLDSDEKIKDLEMFISLLCGGYGSPDTTKRALQIDPYYGSYGVTGYIFSVQGTPTHATAVLDIERSFLYCIPMGARRKFAAIYGKDLHHDVRKFTQQDFYNLAIKMLEYAGLDTRWGQHDSDRASLSFE